MTEDEVRAKAFAMPLYCPSYPPGPYRFINREFFIITYRTDPELLRRIVPAPLEVAAPHVKFEVINMPDSAGFGNYVESGQVIPVTYKGKPGGYVHMMFLNDHPPIAGGRELWGFPKKLADPTFEVVRDTLTGTLDYNGQRVATATMGYKYQSLDAAEVKTALEGDNYMMKILPHVDGTPRVCELVGYNLTDITVKGAWRGPARLELFHNAMAPVADLPVLEVIDAIHINTDLTLPYGRVVHDYLA
ncbi:acetoacetate decarboxylase [Marinibaculum pumilum]|uniref:Acetoacetate decarboxylase n=1 Tax=Marinibaculum pumilum TaxID=1766165 RepID=A0ABV7KWX4_9PROT